MRILHRWIGIIIAIVLIPLTLTGLFLNHSFMPPNQKPFQKTAVNAIAVHPDNSLQIIAATQSDLFMSQNGGKSFQPIRFKYPAKHIQSLSYDSQGTLFATIQQGFLLSTSDLIVWKQHPLPHAINHIETMTVSNQLLTLSDSSGLYQTKRTQPFSWTLVHTRIPPSAFKQWVYKLHTGQLLQGYWIWFNDMAAIGLLLLILTGIKLFIYKK